MPTYKVTVAYQTAVETAEYEVEAIDEFHAMDDAYDMAYDDGFPVLEVIEAEEIK